jgi:phosphohistidine phosphatase SixA
MLAMPLHLVRHAKAGSRQEWTGDDTERPLSPKGWDQANGLKKAFDGVPITRVLSSPYVRCVQTVEPMAEAHGLQVQLEPRLAEGEPFEPVLDLLTTLPDHTVLCSHGDIVPDVIDALARRGTKIKGEPDWRKGARWELVREGDRIVTARPVPPPS